MVFSSENLEEQLLETAAGRAVYDALIQANVNLNTVSVELIKQMLVAECRFLRDPAQTNTPDALLPC